MPGDLNKVALNALKKVGYSHDYSLLFQFTIMIVSFVATLTVPVVTAED